ncbi:helix-turn-helix domain-containing protein [Effusibacillus pohliae]|uniref:helix-turn-helix domain-containing protein n=1 Tax=Effusibacillus pohliae TaxID=232270 RepID=UPI000360AFA9|nr:helix-turn-helix transcriptional regulator [Effusibacillus pohliae]
MASLVRQARLEAGMSIEEAAKKLGISAGYLSQIEKGQRQVGAERAEKIAKLYKKKKEEIFLPSRYAIREVENEHSANTA